MIIKLVRFLFPRSILMAAGGFILGRVISIVTANMGIMALVSYNAAMNIFSLLLSLLSWVIMGGLYLSAIHQEEGRPEKGKRIHKRSLGLTMVLLTAASLVLYFFPNELVQMYGYPEENMASASGYLQAFALASFLFSWLFLLIGQNLRTHSYASVLVPGILLLVAGIGATLAIAQSSIYQSSRMEYIGFVQGALQAVVYIMPFVFIPVKLYSTAFIPQQEAAAPQQEEAVPQPAEQA